MKLKTKIGELEGTPTEIMQVLRLLDKPSKEYASQPKATRTKRTVKRVHWTPEEEILLRKHYEKGGAKAVKAAMLKEIGAARTKPAITFRAHASGLKKNRGLSSLPEAQK